MKEEKLIHIAQKLLGRLQKNFWYLTGHPLLILFLIIVFCVFLSLFYFFAIQQRYTYEDSVVEVDHQKYLRVLERWKQEEQIVETMESKNYFNLFSPKNIEYETNEGEKIEETVEEKFSPEEIEDLLSRTLFEFYKERGMDMPDITERAQLWEELKLGSADSYRGLYQQNVLFLHKEAHCYIFLRFPDLHCKQQGLVQSNQTCYTVFCNTLTRL